MPFQNLIQKIENIVLKFKKVLLSELIGDFAPEFNNCLQMYRLLTTIGVAKI